YSRDGSRGTSLAHMPAVRAMLVARVPAAVKMRGDVRRRYPQGLGDLGGPRSRILGQISSDFLLREAPPARRRRRGVAAQSGTCEEQQLSLPRHCLLVLEQ